MPRNLILALVLTGAAALAGCSTTENANSGTNANNSNLPANANRSSVPSNTGVLTNNNGNENTAGVKPVNGNSNSNRNHNR